MKYLLIYLCFITQAQAWTLGGSGTMGFQTSSDINVYVASNTCQHAGFTSAQMQSLIEDAAATFWNSVPTSSLKLTYISVKNIDTSSSDINTLINNSVSNNQILVGCSADATTFSSGSILAVGGMGCLTNSDCRGAVLLNDTASTLLSSISYDTVKSTFAHELGHALGLGHTSVPEALMYYSATNKVQKKLNQDDIDGITYLYPNEKKVSGFAGACGTIDTKNGGGRNFIISLLIGLMFGILLSTVKKFNKTQKLNF